MPPLIDGIGDYTAKLAKEIAPFDGCESVSILTSNELTDPIPGVQIISVVKHWDWRSFGRIRKEIFRIIPDIINLQYNPFMYGKHGIAISLAFLLLSIKTYSKVKIIATFHELYFPFGRLGLRGLTWALVQRAELIPIGLGTDAMIAATGSRVRSLKQLFPWKNRTIHKIPVGSNIIPLPYLTDTRDITRKHLGIRGNVILLGIFGTLAQHKSLSTIVRVLAHFVDIVEMRLLCIGKIDLNDSTWKETMHLAQKLGVERHIVVTGTTTCDQVSRYLSVLDIYLALYDNGISTVRGTLMAGFAHGLPIIGSQGLHTNNQWFRHGENLILIDKIDTSHLTEALNLLIFDIQLRTKLGKKAKSSFKRDFSWGKIADQYLQLIRKL